MGAAEEYLAAIETRLTKLTIKVEAQTAGLVVERIDSHGVHTTIAEASRGVPVNVDPDRYQIKASAPGFSTYTTGVELDTDGDTKSVEIPALIKIAHHEYTTLPEKSTGPDRLLVTGVVLASVGVVSAAIGIGFGVTTLGDSSQALSDKSLCPNHACSAKGLSFIERAKSESTASTVSLSLGAALAVVGTTMFTWSVVHNAASHSSHDGADPQKPAGADITLVPAAVVLPNGQFAACLTLRGTL